MLEGRVALITGAGRGIGREHALLFAKLGAKVVINDLGGDTAGTDGGDVGPAQTVADEITALGGEAIANTDSVTDYQGAKRMIDAAVEAFGDLHVLVNNAGILRDKMLVSMTDAEWDPVVDVHMKGTFNTMAHAARYWRDQAKAGNAAPRAIVNTSSGAGLHGNVGQTNYAAAKAGIAAMTIVAATELERYNVKVNCIAPIARTRLTLQTEWLADTMKDPTFDPENISPLVACLAAADCTFNGQAFAVAGGAVGLYQGWSVAEEVLTEGRWEVGELWAALEKIPRSIPTRKQTDSLAAIAKASTG